MFELLNEQPALIAEILSFLIEDTQGLAKMRTVSKAWNKAVIPYCLGSRRFLKTCAPPKHKFVQDLVTFNEWAYAGQVYSLRNDHAETFNFLMQDTESADNNDDAWLRTTRFMFLQDYKYSQPDTRYDMPKQVNYSFLKHSAEKFSRYCSTVQTTKSWDEFKATAEKAYADGFFLSVEDLEKSKSEGAKIDLQKGRGRNCMPLILTVTINLDQYTPLQAGSATIVLLKARVNKVDVVPKYGAAERPGLLPFLEFRDLPSIAKESDDSYLYPTFAGYNPVPNDNGSMSCQVPVGLHMGDGLDDLLCELDGTDSYLPIEDLLRKCQEQAVREGVAIADGFVPQDLHKKLMNDIDDVNAKQIVDYHPHSNGIVRDIVHPALYSYVKGVSPQTKSEGEIAALSQDRNVPVEDRVELEDRDYWGRTYEASAKYQWLPTYFSIGDDGSCAINDYINNLVPRSENEALYGSLAQLFSQALPLIESVYGYCRVIKEEQYIRMDDDSEMSYDSVEMESMDEKAVSLRGKEVQVVTKIVDYELGPGETYEGVWHVEGMSHEEIVATAIYFIDRDDDIVGGDILFKRAFHKQEAMYIFSHVAQDRPQAMEEIIDDGLMPLGTVETRQGRLVVFPNSHVHKVSKIENISIEEGGEKQKRRIVVFFLINPERRIVSTREVPVQQEHAGGTMKRKDALEHRLALMKERKYTKQDWNMTDLDGEDGASMLTWTRLILIAAVSFWCQAVVTEERLVPALNVIADRFKIPDDIAGATLMAAGASSPELFSSFVALFITHSAMGMGTIVGSEIFNQLVICAGAVYASKSGELRLDRKIVFREVGFYGLAILLLYIVMQDVREVPMSNEVTDAEDVELEEHIFVSFGGSLMIFAGYIAYVVVCANMKAVVAFSERVSSHSWRRTSYRAIPKVEQADMVEETKDGARDDCNDEDLTIEMIVTKRSDDEDDLLAIDPNTSMEEVVDHEGTVSHRRHVHSTLDSDATLSTIRRKDHQEDQQEHTSLIAFPTNAPEWQILLYFFLLPLRYAMHYTVPDVNVPQQDGALDKTSRAYLATFQCLLWLIMGSYTMVSSLESLATLMNVPDSVVGVTVSAAGTSLPNYIASRIAAEKGLGNQAVSNAFGSNTFNILVGLGLPWTLYTSFVTGFEPYSDLRNDDISESIVILAIVLLVFVVLMAMSDYVLYRWHGHLFAAMYVGYLGLVVFQNWDWDFRIEEEQAAEDDMLT
ncbi:MAG: hypothetical protein SGBAC_007316 [Bacillariaceae sp.]